MNSYWRALLLLTALGLAGYLILFGDEMKRRAPDAVPKSQIPVPEAPARTLKKAESVTRTAPAYTSTSPSRGRAPEALSEAIRLRNLKTVGSFAMSMRLQETCIEFGQNAVNGRARPPTSDPVIEAQRVRAKQELATRCDALANTIDLREPLADDKAGQQFLVSLQDFYGTTGFSPTALKRLADERALTLAADYIASRDNPTVMGKPYAGLQREEFIKAVRLADLIANKPLQATNELQLLRYCAELAACGVGHQAAIESAFNDGKPLDNRTLEVAKRISEAFQSNDPTIFGVDAAQGR